MMVFEAIVRCDALREMLRVSEVKEYRGCNIMCPPIIHNLQYSTERVAGCTPSHKLAHSAETTKVPCAPPKRLQREPTQKTMSARADPLVKRPIVRQVIHRRLGGREDSPSEEVCLINLRH
jgi:hypothetical protein